MKNKILIVVGDPNSINSEIVFKSWKKLNKSIRKRVYLISNYSLLKKQFGMLNYNIGLEKVDNFLLYINMTSELFFIKHFDAKYSVTPD